MQHHEHKPARDLLSDHEIDLLRELHEDHGMGYKRLAEKFEIPRSTARNYARYARRLGGPSSES